VKVRPATPDDADSIWRVHGESIRALCRDRYPPEEIDAWIAVRNPESYRVALRSRELFVADDGGTIVGFGQLDPENGEVEACYVGPAAVGTGVGSSLLARMEDSIRRHGHAVVRLNATLNAESFYAAQGYRRLGAALHRVSGTVELACVRMEKALQESR
jgi:GNAT superfamily N-acetyltransferase